MEIKIEITLEDGRDTKTITLTLDQVKELKKVLDQILNHPGGTDAKNHNP